jgi:hypothetical protein
VHVYAKDNLGFEGLPILTGDSEREGCPWLLALTNWICLFGDYLDSSLASNSDVSSSSSLSSPYSYSLSSSSGYSPWFCLLSSLNLAIWASLLNYNWWFKNEHTISFLTQI